MTFFVGRVLWCLCGVGECGFGHLIVVLCLVHKCESVLLLIKGTLRG